ncbi:helix-turn-helix transcriptional regulator [Hoeflea sp.]|uniref:helix-turn-helix transcriptional regulator n=1 Tax=Hoeflea sp. TaxID=1940281 RepID=UPI003A93ABB7
MQITDPLLTAREGAAFLQISVPTFWRRVADGTIPNPIKLGALSRWPQSEIAAVIEQAKARRNEICENAHEPAAPDAIPSGRA